jgi:glycine cleavage system H lipoate-binding protein
MLPGIYEFRWDAGHIVFLGAFYSVLLVVASTMVLALRRAILAFRAQRVEAIRWHADFDDLPAEARSCRHAITGEAPERICHRGFDCRSCPDHARLEEMRAAQPLESESAAGGFDVPDDRRYHRGHTWVREERDGLCVVGLDDLAARLIGTGAELRLPEPGTRLRLNGTGAEAMRRGVSLRILSPLDGVVVEKGEESSGWLMKIRPDDGASFAHLLAAEEARRWMAREADRLQLAIAPDPIGASLADGGLPVDDISAVVPRERLDDALGMMFLHP